MAGEKHTPSFTETAEFKDAVATAAQAAAQLAVEEWVRKAQILPGTEGAIAEGHPSAPVPPDMMAFMRGMALAIAEVGDQGTNRKRVAPEVLEKRAVARKEMERLIGLTNGLPDDEFPVYELTSKQVLDGPHGPQIIDPYFRDPSSKAVRRTKINWGDVPNEGMIPANAAAKAIHAAFLDSIGSVVKAVPDREQIVTSRGLVILGQQIRGEPESIVGADAGTANNGRLRVLDRHQVGEVVDVAVLGTVAPRARQVA